MRDQGPCVMTRNNRNPKSELIIREITSMTPHKERTYRTSLWKEE